MTHLTLDPTHLRSRGYQLEPLLANRWPIAMELLQSCYPEVPTKLWSDGLQRLRAVPPNDENRPIGMLMHGPHHPVGVTLLFDSTHIQNDLGQRQISASSWAIEPAGRLQALWMAKQTLSTPDTVFTALTPIPQALRILQRLDFSAISHQRVLVMTPLHARRTSTSAHVLNAVETLQAFKDSPLLRALQDHHRLGCIVCAIEMSDRLVPLVLRTRRQSRVIPLAEIIFTPSVEDVAASIVPLSRFLLRRGVLLLEFEAHENEMINIRCTRLFRRRFAKGSYDLKGINHLYSELVYLKN